MTAANLPASIRARLRNLAERDRLAFGAILTRYALERMLYRISIGDHRHEFLLKGALLFDVWFDTPSRPTRDIDLLGSGLADAERIADVFRAACVSNVPDGITFDPITVATTEIRKVADYPGIRATMRGELDGAQIHVQVDIGFGDAVTPGPIPVTFPVLLDDMAPPLLGAYPKATVIAEKLEAIVQLGRVNSRLKDYFDLWVLLTSPDTDRTDIAPAISATFARRGTAIPRATPAGLSQEFAEDPRVVAQWRSFVTRNQLAAPDLADAITQLRDLVMPIFFNAREADPSQPGNSDRLPMT